MSVRHSNLKDADGLHEPKGIDTALAGTVYESTGAGSGTWVPLAGSNVTRIEDLADFPAAVAGVITLAANTVYQIIGAIDIGANRLVMDSNSRVEGAAPTISSISSTTTGNLITSATSFTMEGLALSCPSGAAFSLTGTTAEIALLKSVTILSCTSCGSITTWGFLTDE